MLFYPKENHTLPMDIIMIQLTINDVPVVIIKRLYREHDDEKVRQLFGDLNRVDLRKYRNNEVFLRTILTWRRYTTRFKNIIITIEFPHGMT